MGPFTITQLDARSPREGLAEFESRDQQRTARVRKRARQAVTRMRSDFPGGATTGVPGGDEVAEEQFAALAEDRPCSAADAATGTCDLYAARPITCGIFGPPVDFGSEAVGVCGLCFQWARDEEIAACEVEIDLRGLESRLPNELERTAGALGQTMLVFAAAPAL
jgi:Fe-S-cluster containining protein